MPEYQTFLDGQNTTMFWQFVKWFLYLVAPIILLFFATDIVELLVTVIKKAIGMKTDKNDDDDDYDIYRY